MKLPLGGEGDEERWEVGRGRRGGGGLGKGDLEQSAEPGPLGTKLRDIRPELPIPPENLVFMHNGLGQDNDA